MFTTIKLGMLSGDDGSAKGANADISIIHRLDHTPIDGQLSNLNDVTVEF